MPKDRIGRQPPKYSFALNPYSDFRFSSCPTCERLMNLRKFALLIHIEGAGLLTLGKTCRYCPTCEIIIAHQNELETELVNTFLKRMPDVVGNPYLVLGTVQLKAWREGIQRPLTLEQIQDQTSDFKRYLKLSVDRGGWKHLGRGA